MANLNNALDNKLLLQYLSAAGQDISSGQPISTNVNQVTQQNIASQNFNKLLSLMLGASVTPDNPMKVSTDGNKFKFDIDMSGAEGGGLSGANLSDANKKEAIALMGAGNQTPTTQPQPQPQQTTQQSAQSNISNPFASLTGSDLAGLTPEMISQALQFKMGAEQMGQQEYNDYINNIYKLGMLESQTRPVGVEPVFVKDVPGYGNLTLEQYKALPQSDREYVSYVLASRELGENTLSKSNWENIGNKDKLPTTAMGSSIAKYYEDYKVLPPDSELKRWTELYRDESEPKIPSPVSWTTATQELTKRFGKLDPTGMWAVTPELQWAHRRSQQILTDLKDQGMSPLKAINEAENRARKDQLKLEEKYFTYLKLANGNEEKIDKLKSQFYSQYGYIPIKRSY